MLHARCMELVMMAGEEEPSPARRLLLDKAQNILSQLQAVLRVDDAVSNSLFYIYDYCYLLLARGGKADCSYANQMLAVLRSTFDQLLRNI
jgi:flagellin-specific chaperone FliS